MKIIQIGPTLYQGGVAVAIRDLTNALMALGHKVTLIGNGGDALNSLNKTVDLHHVDFSNKPRAILRNAYHIRKILEKSNPDIVHVHGRGAALTTYLAGRRPDWFTLHNSYLTRQVGILDKGIIRKYLSPLGRRVIVLNHDALEYVCELWNFDSSLIEIIGNGVDCVRFRPPLKEERRKAREDFGAKTSDVVAMFVGRFDGQKQPDAVLNLAIASRSAGLKNIRFVMVGAGELEGHLRDKIRTLQLQNICCVMGWTDPLPAYWAADLLLMPSLYEGFSLVAVEALASGCPILITRTGGYAALIGEGETGFVTDTDPNAFVQRGLEVLKDAEKLAAMRPKARAWAEKYLSIETQAERTVLAYKRSLGERSRAH